MTTTTKYIVHYQQIRATRELTRTYRNLESAKDDLDAYRDAYRDAFVSNGYRDACGSVTPEHLEEHIAALFYIEKQTTESERLDY